MVEIGVPSGLKDAVESLKDAVNAGRTDIFRKLLDAAGSAEYGGGAEEHQQLLNALCTDDGTFLHMATELCRGDIMRALLAAGADPGVQNAEGKTPVELASSPAIRAIYTEELLRATAQSDIGRVCQLVASGLSINSHDNPLSKNTPLHWAASFADTDTLTCLIARGADVNATNSDGATPLHDATARGDVNIVRTLLENGANSHIQCYKGRHKGKTAAELATKSPQLTAVIQEFVDNTPTTYTNGACNGSVSPFMARRNAAEKGLSTSNGLSGSLESLTSMGADSVLSCGAEASTLMNGFNGTIGSTPMAPSRKTSIAASRITPQPRSPLESTSSLELSPRMEQVCERLASSKLTAPPRPLITNTKLNLLWPQPRRITELSGIPWAPPEQATLVIVAGPVPVHNVVDVWNVHKRWFSEVGCRVELGGVVGPRDPPTEHTFTTVVDPALTATPDTYTLTVNQKGVHMVCGSINSLHSGLVTLVQLIRVSNTGTNGSKTASVPPVVITDSPSLTHRGFMLDITPHARVPTLDRLCQMVDSLLAIKMNQLHLMTRLTPTTCALPYSPSEVVSLERYCCDRGVTLVPGFDVDASVKSQHLPQLTQTITATLAHFPSARFVHIGPGLTGLLAEVSHTNSKVETKGSVILSPWSSMTLPPCSVLMVCANVFHGKPHLLETLPLTAVLVEYGFQADYDFTAGAQISLDTGRPLAMCPGTAAWSSLSGWPEAGVSNVYSGVVGGVEAGAVGVVVAHWSSTAALTPLVFAWPPVMVAAGLAWNHNTHWDFVHSSVGELIDTHLVKVPQCGLGAALIELGRCETWVTRVVRGQLPSEVKDLPSSSPGSALYQLFADPDSLPLENLSPDVFSSVMRHVRRVVREGKVNSSSPIMGQSASHQSSRGQGLGQTTLSSPWPLATLVILEVHLAMDMILTACRLGRSLLSAGRNPHSNMGLSVINLGVANLPPTVRTDLANKVLALREVYSTVWLQGQQSAGLQTSLLVLTSLLARLLPDHLLNSELNEHNQINSFN